MWKKFLYFIPFLFLQAFSAKAVCPVCTVAVGAGIGLSRWLGIDDTVTGIWIGALLVSISLWTVDWIGKKSWKFRGYKIVTFVFYVLIIIAPLFWMDIFFHPFNKLWGIDKLILGMILGALSFILSVKLHFVLKKKNNNKVLFPFQKVAITVGVALILSIIFYFITRN